MAAWGEEQAAAQTQTGLVPLTGTPMGQVAIIGRGCWEFTITG